MQGFIIKTPLSLNPRVQISMVSLDGGDNRTRTCDLMRVKQGRGFAPTGNALTRWKPLKILAFWTVCCGRPFFFLRFRPHAVRYWYSIIPPVHDTSPLPYSIHIPEQLSTSLVITEHLPTTQEHPATSINIKKKSDFVKILQTYPIILDRFAV